MQTAQLKFPDDFQNTQLKFPDDSKIIILPEVT